MIHLLRGISKVNKVVLVLVLLPQQFLIIGGNITPLNFIDFLVAGCHFNLMLDGTHLGVHIGVS
jgi:hypothetical protein